MRSASAVAIILIASIVAACGSTPSPSPTEEGPVGRSVREGPFALEVVVGKARYAPDEPIEAQATLRYLGPEGRIEIAGSGGGPIDFGVEDLVGTRDMSPGWRLDCAVHTIDRSLTKPFAKSGGWSEDDPDAAFYRAYFADPLFRLPAGRWRIFALATFAATPGRPALGCGDAQGWTLEASVTIEVAS